MVHSNSSDAEKGRQRFRQVREKREAAARRELVGFLPLFACPAILRAWVFPQPDRMATAVKGSLRRNSTMAGPSEKSSQTCLLVYDGECRLCVTAKKGLDRLDTHADAAPVRMVPYQSEEAKQALGESYRPDRPNAAFLVRPDGGIARGLDAFLALLPGLKGGRILSALLSLPLVKPVGYLLYWFVARYRYAVFGRVPLERASESPRVSSREITHK